MKKLIQSTLLPKILLLTICLFALTVNAGLFGKNINDYIKEADDYLDRDEVDNRFKFPEGEIITEEMFNQKLDEFNKNKNWFQKLEQKIYDKQYQMFEKKLGWDKEGEWDGEPPSPEELEDAYDFKYTPEELIEKVE